MESMLTAARLYAEFARSTLQKLAPDSYAKSSDALFRLQDTCTAYYVISNDYKQTLLTKGKDIYSKPLEYTLCVYDQACSYALSTVQPYQDSLTSRVTATKTQLVARYETTTNYALGVFGKNKQYVTEKYLQLRAIPTQVKSALHEKSQNMVVITQDSFNAAKMFLFTQALFYLNHVTSFLSSHVENAEKAGRDAYAGVQEKIEDFKSVGNKAMCAVQEKASPYVTPLSDVVKYIQEKEESLVGNLTTIKDAYLERALAFKKNVLDHYNGKGTKAA
jgi:hypothetical protein